jgi:uncharacterized protein (DUF362 family)/Pyruvate/2-oxoacid:ferredoxin oxidoreductase delta subunit
MDDTVYVAECPSYEYSEDKLTALFKMMGGLEQFVAPGARVALKANLLIPASPERAATTHPAVVAAVASITKRTGALPFIVDSPGSGYQHLEATLRRLYRVCGMRRAAQEANVELNFDTTYAEVSFPQGELTQRFEIISPILKADAVFNLCKLKTHLFAGLTGAVKNCFGVIPGLFKPGYHAKLQDVHRFADMLLDLNAYLAPRLSIMDAVVGMEGDGPSNGTPRHVGLLLTATNPLALDVVAAEIIGLDRRDNPVLAAAERRGLLPNRIEHVNLVGANLADLRIPDFKVPATTGGIGFVTLPRWQTTLLKPLCKEGTTLRPQVIKSKCIACGACRDACPVTAIGITDDQTAHIDHGTCIRCYCCHEMCPQGAIRLRSSLLYRVLKSYVGF